MGLNSSSVIKIIDLLCEGPIEGIEGGRKGVFLDETPLRSAQGEQLVSKNHVDFEVNLGGRNQSYLPQAKGKTSNVVNVNKEVGTEYTEVLNDAGTLVKKRDYGAGEQVVQISDTDVDSVDLLFTIPRLYSTAQEGLVKGQLFDALIFFKVEIQDEGSGSAFKNIKKSEVSKVSENFKTDEDNVFYIEGISTTNYQYKISGIKLDGTGPWNIRVRKYPQAKYQGKIPHKQSNSGNIDRQIFRASFKEFEEVDKRTPLKNGRANTLVWSAVVENVNIRTAYPFTASAGMSISTEEFQSLPTRAYLVKGKKVRIPHNATVRDDGSLTFEGSFDGSLAEDTAWTTCPVCIFYDLLTNDRYGAGHFVDATNLSWVDLYPLARYANELIDGEPRFACNVQVASQVEAFTVLQDFASVFRGMMYWQSNIIQVTADHGNLDGSNIDPVHIFSNSNVIAGVFNYSGSSLKTRSTSIKIRYSDPDNLYKPNVICIENASLIEKYGYQVKNVLAFGCTSKNQAKRMGRWMMKSEELDQNTVTFAVGLEGALVFPGQVFAIQDELRAASRLSGRISSSTTTTIVTDQSITLPAGGNPILTCVLNDASVESKPIDSDNTSGTTVTVTEAFSSAPLAGAIYSISTDDLNLQKFRCLSVADNGDGTFAVVAAEFNDSIYAAADEAEDLTFIDVTSINELPATPII
jgi:predicted phage tail protein